MISPERPFNVLPRKKNNKFLTIFFLYSDPLTDFTDFFSDILGNTRTRTNGNPGRSDSKKPRFEYRFLGYYSVLDSSLIYIYIYIYISNLLALLVPEI